VIFLPTGLFFPNGIKGPRCIAGFCSISYAGSVVLLLVVGGSFFADYQAWFYYGFLSTIDF